MAGGTEKFDAAGFGHEFAGTGELSAAANDVETDGGGGPLENTGALDDGELNADGGVDGAGSDPAVEPGPTPLPHAPSAAAAAAALSTRADNRQVRAAGNPTVASRRPA
jgi:hypothetical protein